MAYNRKYRSENLEACRARERRYCKEHKVQRREIKKKWVKNNIEKVRAMERQWQKENKEKTREACRRYYNKYKDKIKRKRKEKRKTVEKEENWMRSYAKRIQSLSPFVFPRNCKWQRRGNTNWDNDWVHGWPRCHSHLIGWMTYSPLSRTHVWSQTTLTTRPYPLSTVNGVIVWMPWSPTSWIICRRCRRCSSGKWIYTNRAPKRSWYGERQCRTVLPPWTLSWRTWPPSTPHVNWTDITLS